MLTVLVFMLTGIIWLKFPNYFCCWTWILQTVQTLMRCYFFHHLISVFIVALFIIYGHAQYKQVQLAQVERGHERGHDGIMSSTKTQISLYKPYKSFKPLRLWNFFHAQLSWAWHFNCSWKVKYWKITFFSSFKHSNVVFILLIIVKMPKWHRI